MAKGYYSGTPRVHANKTTEHAATLRRVADELPSGYEGHATEIRTMADRLDKSQGQPRTRNVSGTARHGKMKGQGK